MPIPTFNPGTSVDVKLNTIQTFQPNGDIAQAQMWGEVGDQMEKVARVWNGIDEQNRLAEAEHQGAAAGAEPGFDPAILAQKVNTAADQQFRQGAATSYLSNIDTNTSTALAQINAETFGDPDKLQQRMQAHIDGVAASMPPDISAKYRASAQTRAGAYYANSVSSAGAQAREKQKDDIVAGLETSESALQSLGIPDTAAGQQSYNLETAKYQVRLQQAQDAGVITSGQAALRLQNLKGKMQTSAVQAAVSARPDPMGFALQVAEGKSGTALDGMPVDTRYQAVQFANQIVNARKQALEQQKDERQRTAQGIIDGHALDILNNPTAVDLHQKVDELDAVAQTPEQVLKVGKLKKFAENPSDPDFKPVNSDYGDYLDYQAAKGELSLSDIDTAWGNETPNSRISTDVYKQLNQTVAGVPDKVVGTTAWKTYVAQLEQQFPVPDRRMSAMQSLLSGAGIQKIDFDGKTSNGLTQAQMEQNQRLIKQVLYDTQDKIRNGKIDSEDSLTQYATTKLADLKQTYGGSSVDPANRIKFTTPAEQMAFGLVTTDDTASAMYQRYKDNPGQLAVDIANNRIDTSTPEGVRRANAINRLLKTGQ